MTIRAAIGLLALATAPVAAAPAGFQPGEGLTFTLSVGPIPAGKARMSVGAPLRQQGRLVAAVHGEAHSADWMRLLARLDDDYKVVFDAEALLPRQVHSVETGVRDRAIHSTLDGPQLSLDFAAPKEAYHLARTLPGNALDPVTALFTMRAARLGDGEVVELLVIDGFALYRAAATVVGREQIERDGGPAAAIHLEIEAKRIDDQNRWDKKPPRHISLWLSDDDRRIPYRLAGDTDLGRANVELTSYTADTGKPPARPRRGTARLLAAPLRR